MVLVTMPPILLVSRLASKAMACVMPRTFSLTLTTSSARAPARKPARNARVHLMCGPLLAVLLVRSWLILVPVPRTAVLLCLSSGTSTAVVLSRVRGTLLLPALLSLLVARNASTITAESDGNDLRCLSVDRLGMNASMGDLLCLSALLELVSLEITLVEVTRLVVAILNALAVLLMTRPAPWMGRELAMLKLLASLLLTLAVLTRCLLAVLVLPPRRVVVRS